MVYYTFMEYCYLSHGSIQRQFSREGKMTDEELCSGRQIQYYFSTVIFKD
jgi:hypothetical protein